MSALFMLCPVSAHYYHHVLISVQPWGALFMRGYSMSALRGILVVFWGRNFCSISIHNLHPLNPINFLDKQDFPTSHAYFHIWPSFLIHWESLEDLSLTLNHMKGSFHLWSTHRDSHPSQIHSVFEKKSSNNYILHRLIQTRKSPIFSMEVGKVV